MRERTGIGGGCVIFAQVEDHVQYIVEAQAVGVLCRSLHKPRGEALAAPESRWDSGLPTPAASIKTMLLMFP